MMVKTGLLLLLWVFVLPASGGAVCRLKSEAAVPIQVTDDGITVPVEVNGITARFILDTGAQRTLVTEAAVQRLGLARDPWVGTTLQGIGGIDRRANANPRSLSMGGVALARHTLNHDTSLTVGLLPYLDSKASVIDGALGRDFLSVFDLDLDLPGRRLTLYRVHDCAGRFLPWRGDYSVVPVTGSAQHAFVIPIVLDGKPLQAMLDTGASGSLLAAPGIYRLGLGQAALDGDPADQVSGIGSRAVTMRRHVFHSLRIGDEVIDAPSIWVASIRLTPIVDMLLGADWLAGRRVWISYATDQLFVARP